MNVKGASPAGDVSAGVVPKGSLIQRQRIVRVLEQEAGAPGGQRPADQRPEPEPGQQHQDRVVTAAGVGVPVTGREDRVHVLRPTWHFVAADDIRWMLALGTQALFQTSKRWPGVVKRMLRKRLERELPADYDIDTHFTPHYDPWDQRLCAVPDGDLFAAIRSGAASVVTDHIDT